MFGLATNILFTKPLEFLFMWSYWGFHLAWSALFCQVMSRHNSNYVVPAVYLTEMTFATSVSITVLYWPFEIHNFIRDYTVQSFDENFEYFNAAVVHTFPLFTSLFNIIFSKVVFLKQDAWIAFTINVCYIPMNILGSFAM